MKHLLIDLFNFLATKFSPLINGQDKKHKKKTKHH